MTKLHIWGVLIGFPAFIWFGYQTDWQVAVALFLCLLANNCSQSPKEKVDKDKYIPPVRITGGLVKSGGIIKHTSSMERPPPPPAQRPNRS